MFKSILCAGPFALTAYVDNDNKLWFMATEICELLGIERVHDFVRKLDKDEKTTVDVLELGFLDEEELLRNTLEDAGLDRNMAFEHNGRRYPAIPVDPIQAGKNRLNPSDTDPILTHSTSVNRSRGAQTRTLVNEGGLYSALLRSNKAKQEGTAPYRFRKWVTQEVLPSIYRFGRYVPAGQEARAMAEMREGQFVAALKSLPVHKINYLIREAGKEDSHILNVSGRMEKPMTLEELRKKLKLSNINTLTNQLTVAGVMDDDGSVTELGEQFCVTRQGETYWDHAIIEHLRFCS